MKQRTITIGFDRTFDDDVFGANRGRGERGVHHGPKLTSTEIAHLMSSPQMFAYQMFNSKFLTL